ncbi:MAG: hypothetical protein KR126chlam3_00534 [Chlamydiae bacterium]|nr:hypothetical protein [Chlamydiota bacterium]
MNMQLSIHDPTVCQNLVFKPSLRCLDWAAVASREVAATSEARKVFSRSNSLLSWMGMPKKIHNLERSVVSLSHYGSLGEYIEKIITVFKRFTSLIGIFVSAIQIAYQEGVISLSKYQLTFLDTVGFIGSFALFLKSITDIKKNFVLVFSSRIGSYTFNLSLLKLIGKICGLATGIFGMYTFAFGGGLQAKWIMLGISTISLITTISKYYFTSLYPSEKSTVISDGFY